LLGFDVVKYTSERNKWDLTQDLTQSNTLRKGIKVYLRDVHWRVSRVYLRRVFLVYLPTDAHVPTLK